MPVIPTGDTKDRRAELLPASLLPLFNDEFVRSWDLYGDYVDGLVRECSSTLGFAEQAPDQPETAAEVALRCKLSASGGLAIVDWLLRALVKAGAATLVPTEGDHCYLVGDLRPTGRDESVRDEALAHDPGAGPAYELADAARDALPAVLRGETSGEKALLAPDKMALWSRYFCNDNPLYAVNNLVGAVACAESAPRGPLRILEFGGGMGSAADALLTEFDKQGRLGDVSSYRFTELVMPFLRRGQRMLQARWGDRTPLAFSLLDMNRSFAEQGVDSGSVDVVWAVNTLHVAHDLETTLSGIFDLLAPGGVLVAGECIRPFERQPLPPELIFNLLESFRSPVLNPEWRPQGGFMTPEQWTTACSQAGFDKVSLAPDIATIRDVYPDFVVAAITARKAP